MEDNNNKYLLQENDGYFGEYGGRYVPEMLIPALDELETSFDELKNDKVFNARLNHYLQSYVGRPSVLYESNNLTRVLKEEYGLHKTSRVYLKLESNNHTGAHKINNVIGQILLAMNMGKQHIIAETGAGQHGLATAAACAKFNLQCSIFMGEHDIKRQYPNVYNMKQMGAEIIPVSDGTKTLKDAVNAALKYWVEHVEETHYLLGSALGPHPYPSIVQHFQSIIGREISEQIMSAEARLPDYLIACVGGGSNAMGMFSHFIPHKEITLIGAEAGGLGIDSNKHASRFAESTTSQSARKGIVQGYKSYFLQNEDGQLLDTYSISAGLDYAGVSPQLAHLKDMGRISFYAIEDKIVLKAFQLLAKTEGMISSLESAHALGALIQHSKDFKEDSIIVLNLSGRGDKDIFISAPILEKSEWLAFLEREIEVLKGQQS